MTFFAGAEKSRNGDHVGAILEFDQALLRDPDNPDLYGYRCVARYCTGDRQGAISDCQQAAALYLNQEKAKEYQYALLMLRKLQE